MAIISHRKVHLCPHCKNRLDRILLDTKTIVYRCHTLISDDPPLVCDFELRVIKNDKNCALQTR